MKELSLRKSTFAHQFRSLTQEVKGRFVKGKRCPAQKTSSQASPKPLFDTESIVFLVQNCEDILKTYDLTPREGEVFILLARGRNAQHISERLSISYHTTKSHIYRIYRKLEVSSHQELIDLAEFGERNSQQAYRRI